MRWLVAVLLLAGCTLGPTPESFESTSSRQVGYVGPNARPPKGSPAKYVAANNCGTPDRWKACPAPRRAYVTISTIDLASTPEEMRQLDDFTVQRDDL